jgi:hypothetical protein
MGYISNLALSQDRIDYHPLGDVLSHVKLVVLKATLLVGDKNVIAAAWLHDICKSPEFGGYERTDSQGRIYHSNPDHARQAVDVILSNDDIRYWIRNRRCNQDTVLDIIGAHMSVKNGIPKKYKSIPFIDAFTMCDDDVNRISQTSLVRGVQGKFLHSRPDFVGLAQLDILKENRIFTVTINRMPYRYSFDQISKFIGNTPEV